MSRGRLGVPRRTSDRNHVSANMPVPVSDGQLYMSTDGPATSNDAGRQGRRSDRVFISNSAPSAAIIFSRRDVAFSHSTLDQKHGFVAGTGDANVL